jgi:hypothetical protein
MRKIQNANITFRVTNDLKELLLNIAFRTTATIRSSSASPWLLI